MYVAYVRWWGWLEGSLVCVANLWCIVESTGCHGLLVRLPSTSITHRLISTSTQNIASITSQAWDTGHLSTPEPEKQEIRFSWMPVALRKSRRLCVIVTLKIAVNVIRIIGMYMYVCTCMYVGTQGYN